MESKSENIQKELKDILGLLKNYDEGKSLKGIQSEFKPEIDRRTLQRRIKELIVSGKVVTSGKGRATKYSLVKTSEGIAVEPSSTSLLPLSNEGKEIQHIVSQSQQKRHPVGYNRAFLDTYQPNITSYLTVDEKNKLEELGVTARINEPAGTYAKEILQRLLIDLAWNSSRLEGNTYSLLDTQRLISEGVSADNKSATEAQMILNHKDAI